MWVMIMVIASRDRGKSLHLQVCALVRRSEKVHTRTLLPKWPKLDKMMLYTPPTRGEGHVQHLDPCVRFSKTPFEAHAFIEKFSPRNEESSALKDHI